MRIVLGVIIGIYAVATLIVAVEAVKAPTLEDYDIEDEQETKY